MKDLGSESDNRLPRIPKITPEKQAEIDAEQAKLAERFDATGRVYDRAYAVIKESEPIPLKDMTPIQRENYAEALADVGKFKEAAKVTRIEERKAYFKAVNKAVWLDDDKRCRCRDTKTVVLEGNQPTEVEYDRHFAVREIFSEKHGKRVNLYKCNSCGLLNARG